MALIEFVNDSAPYLSAENLNNNFEYLDDKIPNIVNQHSNSQEDAYNCDYINDLHNYSSEEHIIGTFNNKPLYRKSFKVLITSQTFEFNHGITNMDDLVKYNASIIQQGGYKYPIPYYSEIAGYTIEGGVSSTGCYFKLGNSINYNHYATVVLEYTKTTD